MRISLSSWRRRGKPAPSRPFVLPLCLIAAALAASGPRASAETLRCKIVPARSTVRFDAQATAHTVHGSTQQVSGEILFDPDNLSDRAEVKLRIDAASLATGNRVRDKKMRESHLETGPHPLILFRSSKVEAVAPSLRDGETQEMKVTGTLSLHGVDRTITLTVKAVRRGGDLRVTGQTTVLMSDFAIPIPKFLFTSVKDPVKVMFEVVATVPQGKKPA
jgi:polyisoprenoid-binding protein YceI